jgi:hypothetical protein
VIAYSMFDLLLKLVASKHLSFASSIVLSMARLTHSRRDEPLVHFDRAGLRSAEMPQHRLRVYQTRTVLTNVSAVSAVLVVLRSPPSSLSLDSNVCIEPTRPDNDPSGRGSPCSALKQVPNLLVLAIEILAVAGQETLHNSAYLIVLPFNQKVCVVWHQAVGVKIEGQFCFLLSDHACELEVVVVRTKDLSSIIAAADDVVEPSGTSIRGFLAIAARAYD